MLNKVNKGRGIANEQPSKKWQAYRKAWSKVTRGLTSHDLNMEAKISRDINSIIATLKSSQGRPIDVSKVVHMALCNIICSLCFGKSFSYDDPDFQKLLKMADQFFRYLSSASAVNFFPILWYLPLKANRAVTEGYEGIFAFVKKLVEEKQDGQWKSEAHGFIDVCLDEAKSKNCGGLRKKSNKMSADIQDKNNDRRGLKRTVVNGECDFISNKDFNVRDNMAHEEIDKKEKDALETPDEYNQQAICEDVTYVATDMFIGGAETTHAGVMWGLVFMVLYPDIQAKVQKELDDVAGDSLPVWSDRHRLPYTQACLQEILRLGNVIPIAIPHVTTSDVTLSNGCHLPRGTTVLSNLYSCHMDPTAWKTPEEFQPERFLDCEGKLKRFDHFMPFSLGRRMCIGEQLAHMELYLAFTHILIMFDVSLAPNKRQPSLDGRPGITHSPYRFKICAVSRKS
nr:cytochrome P450 2U1-like [Lytechinus pictus]